MSLEGLSGNPRYVNNKCGWLKKQGWEPIVFWSLDMTQIDLPHTKPFGEKKYIYHEMNFFPSWFTAMRRNTIVNSIIKTIGEADEIVVESNKLQLGAWGELIAKKINAKHINFVTTERLKIHNRNTFDFCYTKLQRGEFFNINKPAVQLLFSKFVDIKEPEKYYWSALMGVDVEEVPFPAFDNLPKADYTITHFGRTKGYFSYMVDELKRFISHYPDKTFNIFFLGQIKEEESLKRNLAFSNVNVAFHLPVMTVPSQLFKKSDVVIGTAGCAWLSVNNGGKTISMDVNNSQPLGLLCYTTLDSNTYSGKYQNNQSLSEWLEILLIKKESYVKMDISNLVHGFEYQMQYVTPSDGFYLDTTKYREPITRNDWLYISLTKIGLFSLVDSIFFRKIRRKRKFDR